MMERALSDEHLLITEITTSSNSRMRAGALSELHVGDVSHPSTSDQADGVVEAVVKFARRCTMALRLRRPACAPLSGRPRGLMPPLGVEALLMGNFNVLYSSCLHVDAGLQRF